MVGEITGSSVYGQLAFLLKKEWRFYMREVLSALININRGNILIWMAHRKQNIFNNV